MKVLLAFVVLLGMASCALGLPSAASLLNAAVPPPPRHHSAALQQIQHAAAAVPVAHTPAETSLLAVATHAQATVAAKAAQQAALAVDEQLLASMEVEDHLTAKGQLSAEERLLVDRMVAVPKTFIPDDPAKPVVYMAPPTRDVLTPQGKRGYPWPEKLQNALTTIEEAAKTRIGQIKQQSKWSKDAKGLVSQLSLKKNKVNAHVAQLTQEIKDLLGKKKQIQNKQLQDKLVERLEIAHANIKKVRRQTHNIRKNQAEMIHHKEELAHALEGIKRSLAILKGMKRQRQFPDRGSAQKLKDQLALFDPDLSNEAESDEVRALAFPDAVLAEVGAEAAAPGSEEDFPNLSREEADELQQLE